MIICPHPISEWGSDLSHFGLFVLGSAHFLQSFLGYGSKKSEIFYGIYRKPTYKQAKNR